MANDFDVQIKWLNGSQIEIQAENASTLAGTEKVLIMDGGEAKETTTQDIADLGGGGGSSYLVYTAVITQIGENNAPTAVIIQNTLGGVPVWSYNSPGYFILTLEGAFTENKTIAFVGTGQQDATLYSFGNENQPDSVFLSAPGNNDFFNTPIEIRVYP